MVHDLEKFESEKVSRLKLKLFEAKTEKGLRMRSSEKKENGIKRGIISHQRGLI